MLAVKDSKVLSSSSLNQWSHRNTNMILMLQLQLVLFKIWTTNDFKLNIEVNHATLAQHTFEHELAVAANEICLVV